MVLIFIFKVQAQLVSAVRMAISTASGPLLLDAGLELATRVCLRTKTKFLICYYHSIPPFSQTCTPSIYYILLLIHLCFIKKKQVMTSSIIGGDRVALSRLFSLITRPLSDIEGLFYPSFADWVVCKVFQFS